jgi:dolichol-phosphate mannosyltransferase
MKTTVVIPTYNEKDNISSLVKQILSVEPQFRILIVDDNSPDGTGKIADQIASNDSQVKVLHRTAKEGLGKAYLAAFKYLLQSDTDYIVTMDADFSHDPKYLPNLLEGIEEDIDAVIGSRYLRGVSVLNWPLSRLILSVLANRYVRLVTGLPIKDCTSGFACYKRGVLKKIDLEAIRSEGYAFLVELKYKIFIKGFKIKEVPIVFTERQDGCSKMSHGVIIEALFMPWKLRMRLGNDFNKS